MNESELRALLNKIKECRIGVVGDFCLDAYLFIDQAGSESSVETGLPTFPVRKSRFFPGGAGNVAANLSALGVKTVLAFGVRGSDIFGEELERLLKEQDIETQGLKIQKEDWHTHVYTKLYEGDKELNRIDFGNFNALHEDTIALVLKCLEKALPELDLIIINQQISGGIHTSAFRERIKKLMAKHPERLFIADSRDYPDEYNGAIRKINDREGARFSGLEGPEEIAEKLYARWRKPLFLTRGEHGCLVYDERGCREIHGLQIISRTDPVGAGDSMLAGISAALAAGEDPIGAAELGNFTAGVTVQKIFQTGTAAPEEILEIGSDPDFRYRPELAARPRKARYLNETEIEIITPLSEKLRISQAIFDHDGTVSTLRQGWEEVMEPMMVRSILGDELKGADEKLYNRVIRTVRDYIDKTTGVQTLVQMKGLVEMVRDFGLVPKDRITDEYGYKENFKRELQESVKKRLEKFGRGELDLRDLTIKNALSFLVALRERGILLYLASGTDQEEVEEEAKALGYADLFRGGIYGSVGEVTKEPKKMVLKTILEKIGKSNAREIVTFGDGPVEIRETHKRGAFAVGVASDEIRRYGLNEVKRTRLVEAGADIIIPDFSQWEYLLEIINPGG